MGMYGLASRLEDHLAVERNLLNKPALYSKLSRGLFCGWTWMSRQPGMQLCPERVKIGRE